MSRGDEDAQNPVFSLGMGLAALIRMTDWDPTRPRRRTWGELEARESDAAVLVWMGRVQGFLRQFNASDDRLQTYRRILHVALGTELGTRKSIPDLDAFLETLEVLIVWLQDRHPILFEAIDAGLVRDVVCWWEDGRLGRDHIPQPDGSIRQSAPGTDGRTRGRGSRGRVETTERPAETPE